MNRSAFVKLATTAAVCLLLAVLLTNALARQSNVWDSLGLLVDIRRQLVDRYVTEPDEKAMIQAAVRGMIRSLDDPHTVYLPAEQLDHFEQMVTGTFSGIGAEIELYEDPSDDTYLRIITPLEDSPAWKVGIMAGDIVLEVDGKTTRNEKLLEARNRLIGKPGTNVNLLIRHLSGDEETITITRQTIEVPIVRGFRRHADGRFVYQLDPDNGIGYVRITQFSERTTEKLHQAINQLLADTDTPLQGLILDLRFNPGGLLPSAITVSDTFLTKGKRIVSVKGRNVPEQVFNATDKTLLPDVPIVVLANGASASASEIVTGALADNQRALFVGSRTYGKGSVQEIKMLAPELGALKLTNAYYYLPNGRNIHRRHISSDAKTLNGEPDEKTDDNADPQADRKQWGVDPSPGCYVPMNFEQLKAMNEARRDSDLLRAEPGEKPLPPVTHAWIEYELKDPQLAAALTAMLGKLETDQWPTVGQDGADLLVKQSHRYELRRRRDYLRKRLKKVEEEVATLDAPDTLETPDNPDAPVPITQDENTPAATQPTPVDSP